MLLDGAGGRSAGRARFAAASSASTNVEDKPYTSKPYPPFTTSTLQQEANRKLGFTARRTMQVAQSLYENGHITYMRTDSTNLAQVAIEDARDWSPRNTAASILPAEAARLQVEGQERPGSPRRHSPGRPSVRVARQRCATSSTPTSSSCSR